MAKYIVINILFVGKKKKKKMKSAFDEELTNTARSNVRQLRAG